MVSCVASVARLPIRPARRGARFAKETKRSSHLFGRGWRVASRPSRYERQDCWYLRARIDKLERTANLSSAKRA